jgi:hypothetical protein
MRLPFKILKLVVLFNKIVLYEWSQSENNRRIDGIKGGEITVQHLYSMYVRGVSFRF